MITKEKRKEIEELIIRVFSAVDKSGANSQYYQNLFSDMSDEKFFKWISGRLPFRLHTSPFTTEPTLAECEDGFKILKKPLLEKVNLNYLAKNENGDAIQSKECLVGYLNIKRLKQMMAKKTNAAIEITKRDMKTGRLLGDDKGGIESDKEFEGAMALNLENTAVEYSRFKAASMEAKAEAYNLINVKGEVSFSEIDTKKSDSIAKNTLNVYMLGANIHSNLVDENYYTPHTLERRKNNISRQQDE